MSVALRGSLEAFGIADVFQLIGQQRKTGVLELRGEPGRVEIRFDRGAVVSAAPVRERAHAALGEMLVRSGLLDAARLDELLRESEASAWSAPVLAVERGWLDAETLEATEDLLTRETLFAVLRWRSGSFDFRAQAVEHARDAASLQGAEQILMDGLRMVDEWQSFASLVPSETMVFEPVADLARWRADAGANALPFATVERVFGLVDGRRDVRELIDRSRLGTFEAVRALAELRRTGVVASAERSAGPAPAAAERNARGRLGPRAVLATALPMALLALVAGAALRAPRADALPGFPIEHGPLARVRAEHAERARRHAEAAERFASGARGDAGGAADAARATGAGAAPMAGVAEGAYARAPSGGGAAVLAPER